MIKACSQFMQIARVIRALAFDHQQGFIHQSQHIDLDILSTQSDLCILSHARDPPHQRGGKDILHAHLGIRISRLTLWRVYVKKVSQKIRGAKDIDRYEQALIRPDDWSILDVELPRMSLPSIFCA